MSEYTMNVALNGEYTSAWCYFAITHVNRVLVVLHPFFPAILTK